MEAVIDLPECRCQHESSSSTLAATFNLLVVVLFLPLLSVIGVLFNILNIRVYSRRGDNASVYLAALACSDVGVCLAGIFVISADSLRAYSHPVDQLFVHLLPKTIPAGLFFQMLSVYITVLAAVDCFLYVSRGAHLNTRSIVYLVLVIVVYNAVQFWDLEAVQCASGETNVTQVELCPTEFRVSEPYVVYYKGYAYALFMAFLPFFFLSGLTIAIVYYMRRRPRTPYPLATTSSSIPPSSPIVLLLVILLFLVCNITSLMVNIFEMFQISLGTDAEAVLIDVGNLLVVVNATANFLVYLASDGNFAQDLRIVWRTNRCVEKHRPLCEDVKRFDMIDGMPLTGPTFL